MKQRNDAKETPDKWYERERAAFIAWWEAEGQKKFSDTTTIAAGAGWLARAEAAISSSDVDLVPLTGAEPSTKEQDVYYREMQMRQEEWARRANAYPRLVEALRECICIADSYGLARAGQVGRGLLSELGEP